MDNDKALYLMVKSNLVILESMHMALATVKRYFELLNEAHGPVPARTDAAEVLGGQMGNIDKMCDEIMDEFTKGGNIH